MVFILLGLIFIDYLLIKGIEKVNFSLNCKNDFQLFKLNLFLQRSHTQIKPALIAHGIYEVYAIISSIRSIYQYLFLHVIGDLTVFFMVVIFLANFFNIYFFICLYSLYEKIRREKLTFQTDQYNNGL